MKRSSEPEHCTGQVAGGGGGSGATDPQRGEEQYQRQLSAGGGGGSRPLLSSVDESSVEEGMMPSAPSQLLHNQPEQGPASSQCDQATTTVLASSFKDKMKLVGSYSFLVLLNNEILQGIGSSSVSISTKLDYILK